MQPTSRNVWNLCKRCVESSGQKIGGFLLLTITVGLAASTADDILVFEQCSREPPSRFLTAVQVKVKVKGPPRKFHLAGVIITSCIVSLLFYLLKKSYRLKVREDVKNAIHSTADNLCISTCCEGRLINGCFRAWRIARKALKKAEGDRRTQELLGVCIKQGGWQESTIGFAHQGQLVSCSFPVYGSQGTAEMRLKAVRAPRNGSWTNFFGCGQWELISIEADICELRGGKGNLQSINLMN